jgi:hypothetical protein
MRQERRRGGERAGGRGGEEERGQAEEKQEDARACYLSIDSRTTIDSSTTSRRVWSAVNMLCSHTHKP